MQQSMALGRNLVWFVWEGVGENCSQTTAHFFSGQTGAVGMNRCTCTRESSLS